MAIQNIINASARLDKANQYDPFSEGLKQIEKGFNAMETFEKQQNEKAMSSAENFVDDAIGYDLFPPAAQEIIYGKLKTNGEDLAAADAAGDKKRVRELKLKGVDLIAITNTLGSILKDHSEDLLGTGGEGNYSNGSNTSMMDMLINGEYTIRDDEENGMVIDFNGNGYTGKSGVKMDELDEHVFLKMKDGAVAYNDAIKSIRNSSSKGFPMETDAFKKTIKQTLNTDHKLITSIWDDNFTLKDGKTLKDLWQEENPSLDANEYLRTSGAEWKNYKEELRTWASSKLFTGGQNNYRKYSPGPPNSNPSTPGTLAERREQNTLNSFSTQVADLTKKPKGQARIQLGDGMGVLSINKNGEDYTLTRKYYDESTKEESVEDLSIDQAFNKMSKSGLLAKNELSEVYSLFNETDQRNAGKNNLGVEVIEADDADVKSMILEKYSGVKVNKNISGTDDAGVEVIEVVAENGARQVVYLQGENGTDKEKELEKLNNFLEKNATINVSTKYNSSKD